ncbi:hypothetical protein ACT8ZV_15255 [Nocardioides sp. MAHUQ-72]|uniref:hypothetical protein n=1 Tax=unclassified Nocardioides TaxID=2615069 RepID=UPI003618429D
MKRGLRPRSVLLVLLLAVLVNLPVAHDGWTRWRVERSGTDVTATVVDHTVLGSGSGAEHYLSFRYDEDVDPDQRTWTVEVDEATYDAAVADEQLTVRVVPDDPGAYSVDGEVTSRVGLVLTLVADLVLAALVLLAWRLGGRRRPRLFVVATTDVASCERGTALERISGDLYLVRGEVSAIEGDRIVLDLGDREVAVTLDGHRNAVDRHQPAEVHGRLVG